MQVRYVFDPDLSQARSRLAHALLPALAAAVQDVTALDFKAEATGPLSDPRWQAHYPLLARPPLAPQLLIHHADAAQFRPHPLHWNILIGPAAPEQLQRADEVWVFDRTAQDQALAAGVAQTQIHLLPAAAGSPATAGELPLELTAEKVILARFTQLESPGLDALLRAYLPTFAGQPDVTLMLHLDLAASESAEEALLNQVMALCAELGVDAEQIQLETWMGPLEAPAWQALLNRAAVLVVPDDPLLSREAEAQGTAVAAPTAGALQEALQTAASPGSDGVSELVNTLCARLQALAPSVDFAARAARYQAEQEQARQGRKQKYSLFHSDYKPEEMQARRSWHLRYAQQFVGAPGDVLDIGCGSAIFLELMRDLGLSAFGVDPDPDMVAVCQELGLQALLGDERSLADYPPESLGGIHASHIIEHIDGDRAIALVENAFRSLRPGGLLLIRTPNWRNAQVRHEGFWLDITHVRPYPLPLLQQVLGDAGFEIASMGFEEFGWNDTYIAGRKP
ncbi:MAG: methyltransferase domain-containing protein [Candidatus Sericytochromatia bacterium]